VSFPTLLWTVASSSARFFILVFLSSASQKSPALIMASNSTSSSAPSTSNEMFGYSPSLPMAWMGSILFTVSTLLHVFQYFKHRAFYLYLFLIGLGSKPTAPWRRLNTC
jgi:hypothetical protein